LQEAEKRAQTIKTITDDDVLLFKAVVWSSRLKTKKSEDKKKDLKSELSSGPVRHLKEQIQSEYQGLSEKTY